MDFGFNRFKAWNYICDGNSGICFILCVSQITTSVGLIEKNELLLLVMIMINVGILRLGLQSKVLIFY